MISTNARRVARPLGLSGTVRAGCAMPQVSGAVTIAASSAAVWVVLADFGAIERWSPVVLKSYLTGDAGSGPGATRHCDLFPRGEVEERIDGWDEGRSLVIEVAPNGPMATQTSTFTLAPSEDGTTIEVTMAFDFELVDDARDREARVAEALGGTATQVLAGLKHHVETGEVVGTEVPEPGG